MHEHYVREIDVWARTDVDAIVIDDWGTQRGMLIDPVVWREFFKPLYRESTSSGFTPRASSPSCTPTATSSTSTRI